MTADSFDEAALKEARKRLEEAKARRPSIAQREPAITRLVASVERMREENNFAPRIQRGRWPWE